MITEDYCRGFMDAMGMIERNRAHLRHLLRLPEESQADVLRRVYARDPGALVERSADVVLATVEMIAETVDLYLVPGIVGCSVGPGGEAVYARVKIEAVPR